MSHITQKQIDNILNSKLPSPAALLKSAICTRCGALRALEKYCTYCAKKRAIKTKQRRELERLGVFYKSDMDYVYERLFEGRKLKPHRMKDLKYRTLLSLLWELERVIELTSDGSVRVAIHNQPKTEYLLKLLKKLKRGWGKPVSRGNYRDCIEIAQLVGGEFGLTV